MVPITGIDQYCYWSTDGVAWDTLGKVIDGYVDLSPNIQDRRGIGAQHAMVGGSTAPSGDVVFYPQTKVFLSSHVLRSSMTSPSLTSLYFEGGSASDGSAWQYSGAKVDGCVLECSIDDALTADVTWIATSEASGGSASATESSNVTYEWFEGVVTIAGNTCECQSMRVEINNNLQPYYSLDESVSDKRLPDGLTIGNEEVRLTTEVLTFPQETQIESWIWADSVATDITASYAFTGTDTITVSLANLACAGISVPFEVGNGAVVYRLAFVGQSSQPDTLEIT